MIRFRYRQEVDDTVWTSDPFTAETMSHVRQGVIAGFLGGKARQAIDETTGAVLYGLDRKGAESKVPL